MSDQQEEENNEASDGEPVDPFGPTQVDPKRAFEMGAETPDAHAVPAHWSPPEPEVLDPLFPDYDLIELIGRGGMGAVYRGVQKSLDRSVAIKVLPPEMAEADPSFAARFEREAKSMARLDHANIVHVYDFGRTEAGHWFIVMEFVDGMDFHQLIRSGELDQTGALNAVSQICDALEYAHEQGYVHRDIKPANIFINQKGILKVGDFGLAKMIEGDAEDSETRDQPILTQTGISMGTPDYCAPEQLEGRQIDHRADIYSLGVMFYEMLTRELPRGNFPPPSKKVQVDVRIDDVVLRAMESEPERRYSSAGEMRTEVDEVRTGEAVTPDVANDPASDTPKRQSWIEDPVRRVRVQQLLIFLAVLLFCAAAGFSWYASHLRLKAAELKLGPAEPDKLDSPVISEGKDTRPPWAGTRADPATFGLPAFHGELRPIPGTAGWRTEEPGELVKIELKPNDTNPEQLGLSEMPEGLADIISIYKIQSGATAMALRSDGSLIGWGNDFSSLTEMPPELRDVVAVDFHTEAGIALHRDGTVTGWPLHSNHRMREVSKANLQRVVSICLVHSQMILLVTADGKLHAFGNEPEMPFVPKLTNVRAVVSDGTRQVLALHKDGTLSGFLALNPDAKREYLINFPKDLPPVHSMTGGCALLLENGNVIGWETKSPYLSFVFARGADGLGISSSSTDIWARLPGLKWKAMGINVAHPKDAAKAIEGIELMARIGNHAIGIRPPQSQLPSGQNFPSASATKDAPFANSLNMEFVPVPIPGGPTGGKRVLFSKWETRVADYRAFVEATDHEWPAPEFEQGDDHPAVNVSWEDAVAFCDWLTEREREAGTIGSTQRYRLPSDHEWSCAVEIGHLEDPDASPISKSPSKQDGVKDDKAQGFPMGDRVWTGFSNGASEETKAAGLSNAIVMGLKDGYAATAPVGSFKPNRFGLFDLSGNAWEWCEDTIDPESKYERVRRGTCWKTSSIPMKRSAMRNGATQDERSDVNGFRCVLSEK